MSDKFQRLQNLEKIHLVLESQFSREKAKISSQKNYNPLDRGGPLENQRLLIKNTNSSNCIQQRIPTESWAQILKKGTSQQGPSISQIYQSCYNTIESQIEAQILKESNNRNNRFVENLKREFIHKGSSSTHQNQNPTP